MCSIVQNNSRPLGAEDLHLYLTAVSWDACHSSIEDGDQPPESPCWTHCCRQCSMPGSTTCLPGNDNPLEGVTSFPLQPHLPQCREDAGDSWINMEMVCYLCQEFQIKNVALMKQFGEFINHKGLTLVILSPTVTESPKVELP